MIGMTSLIPWPSSTISNQMTRLFTIVVGLHALICHMPMLLATIVVNFAQVFRLDLASVGNIKGIGSDTFLFTCCVAFL